MAVGPLLANHAEIWTYQTKSGNTELTVGDWDVPEAAGQTFFKGTPVMLSAGGFVQAWDGITVVNGILGVTNEDGHNLASNGLGAPSPFTPVLFPGTGTTFGSVPFQGSAVNIPEGAPLSLGYITVAQANLDTIFLGQVDNSVSTLAVTPTQATIAPGSNQFGMTKDANGRWYIDLGKNTPGTNTVVQVIGFTIDGLTANARVLFQFIKSSMQMVP
jgi:hypothetical protein